MVDGSDYVLTLLKDGGRPVELVYPTEGTPLVVGPNGVFKGAPNPNAARLFNAYCFCSRRSNSSSTSAPCGRYTRTPGNARGASRSPRSRP